jgi:hypothetical protein
MQSYQECGHTDLTKTPCFIIRCEENFITTKFFSYFLFILVEKPVFLLPMHKVRGCLEMVYSICFPMSYGANLKTPELIFLKTHRNF